MSDKPKFTPTDLGEWTYVEDVAGSRVVIDGHGFSSPYWLPHGSGRCERQVASNRLISAAPELHAVAEALLLFHSGGDWGDDKRKRWREIASSDEATTKALCDLARAAMAKARGE